MKSIKLLILLVITLFITPSAFAVAPLYGYLTGLNKAELLERSWFTPSSNERTRIRAYIADKWPDSAEGLMCKGHLLGLDKKPEKAQQYYKKAIQKDTTNPMLFIKSTSYYRNPDGYETALKLYEKAEGVDASFNHYNAIRSSFNILVDDIKDNNRAFQYIYKKRSQYGDKASFDYVLGQYYYYNDNNYQKALELYKSGIQKEDGANFFSLWESYYKTKIKVLNQNGNLSNQDKYGVMRELLRQAEALQSNFPSVTSQGFSQKIHKLIGDELLKAKSYNYAIKMYMAAYTAYPTTELLLKLNDKRHVDQPDFADRFILKNAPYFGNDSTTLYLLGEQYRYQDQFKKSKSYFEKSLRYAKTDEEKYQAAYALNFLYVTVTLNNKSVSHKLDALINSTRSIDILYQAAWSALIRHDLPAAKEYIRQFKAKKRFKPEYLTKLQSTYDYLLELEVESNSFYGDGSFGKYWSNNYADGLRINVNFKSGSAVIDSSDTAKLKKVGQILSQKGAEKYAFIVEGHTDNVGTDNINQPLSEKRATAVVRYLNQQAGIPFAQLKPIGYGAKYPVATNTTNTGKKANRRVEISLAGSIDKPEIKATTTLVADWATVSPNDQYIASGYQPMKIWDAEKKIELKSFNGYHRIRSFSPNGKYLAAVRTSVEGYKSISTLVLYNTMTMKPEKYYTFPGKLGLITWSPFSDSIMAYSFYGNLYKIDIRTGKMISKHTENVTGVAVNMVWVKDKNYLAMVYKTANATVRIYSADNLKHIKDITGNWIHGVTATNNGKYLVLTTDSRELYRYDTTSWDITKMKIPSLTTKMEPYKTDKLLLSDFGSTKAQQVSMFDVTNMKIIAKNTFTRESPSISVGNNIILTYYGPDMKVLKRLDPKTLKVIDTYTGQTEIGRKVYADEENNYVITTDAEGVHVWNLKTGRKIHIWKGDYKKVYQPEPLQSKYFAIQTDKATHTSTLYMLNTSNLTKTKVANLGNIVPKHIGDVSDKLIITGRAFRIDEKVSRTGMVIILDKFTGKMEKQIHVPLVTKPLNYGTLYDAEFTNIAVNPDLTQLVYTSKWVDGWKRGDTFSDYARVFDINTENEICKASYNRNDNRFGYIDSEQFTNGSKIFNSRNCYKQGKYAKQKRQGNLYQYNRQSSTDFGKLGIDISLSSDNTLKIFDKNKKLRLTIINKKNNEWIAYTPEGHYSSSLNGDKGVSWYMAGKVMPFESVKKRMKRPLIIQEEMQRLLSGGSSTPVAKALNIENFNIPYHMTLISPAELTTKNNTYELIIDVEVIDPKAATPKIVYSQNGRWQNERALKPKRKDNVVRITKQFTLQNGENKLIAAIDYKGNRLSPVEVTINYAADETAQPKQKLWFLGVGVSEYAKASQNLNFAHRDAIELGKSLKAQEGKLFSEVNTKILTNSDATVTNIKRSIHKFLKNAGKDDIVILFIAGHGLQDDQNNLYYIAHDSDGDEPYTGLEVSYFENFLRKRPTGQKAIFWMDICHAGAYGTSAPKVGLTAEEAVSLLADGTDTVVFASSSGREQSLESESYGNGHGAFTYALLSGLKGDADLKMGDRDGFVNLLELTFYVTRQVPKFTNNQQHPTIPHISHLRDYPLSHY